MELNKLIKDIKYIKKRNSWCRVAMPKLYLESLTCVIVQYEVDSSLQATLYIKVVKTAPLTVLRYIMGFETPTLTVLRYITVF